MTPSADIGGLALLLSLALGSVAEAQSSISDTALESLPSEGVPSEYGLRTGSFIAAPVPFGNPTIGNGLALGGAWLFNADEDSDASSLAFGGFKTDNGSLGYGFGVDLNLNSNRYQLSFLAARADVTYAFTGNRADIQLNQTADIYKLDLTYGFSPNLSAGLGLRQATTSITPELGLGEILPREVERSLDLEVFKYGVLFEWDNRDDDIFPTSGWRLAFDAFHADVTGNADGDYQKAVLTYGFFTPGLGAGDVVAFTTTVCGASDEAPFFDACGIGLVDSFRGFSVTEFIDDRLLSAQSEYRGRLGQSRIGYALFAGLGLVGDDFSTLLNQDLHAAAGVGLRYRVSKSFPVDFAVDFTWNNDGDELYYVTIGTAF